MIGSKFFHALGYNVPENYIVRFTAGQLELNGEIQHPRLPRHAARHEPAGRATTFCSKVPRDLERRYRALASLIIPGDLIGPFRYSRRAVGRSQRHRAARGPPRPARPVRLRRLAQPHRFEVPQQPGYGGRGEGAPLHPALPDRLRRHPGQRQLRGQKPPRGQSSTCSTSSRRRRSSSAWGFTCPAWQRANFPEIPGVGNLEYEVFDPARWKSNYPNPAFDRRLPGRRLLGREEGDGLHRRADPGDGRGRAIQRPARGGLDRAGADCAPRQDRARLPERRAAARRFRRAQQPPCLRGPGGEVRLRQPPGLPGGVVCVR